MADIPPATDIFEPEDRAPVPGFDLEAIRQDHAKLQQEREQYRQRYNLELSNEEYLHLDSIARQMDTDEGSTEEYDDTIFRYGTALKLSRMHGMPFQYAYENLDTLMGSQYPHAKVPKEWYRAVSDSFLIGGNTVEMIDLATRIRAARGDTEKRNQLFQEFKKLKDENLTLQDGVSRNFIVEGLKTTGESSGIMARSMAARGLGSLVHPALGFALGAAVSAYDMVYLAYMDFMDQGMPEDIAWSSALTAGVINGVVEQLSGPEALFAGTGAGKLIFKKLALGGSVAAFGRAAGAYFLESAGEGITETIQTGVEQKVSDTGKQKTEQRVHEAAARGELPPVEDDLTPAEQALEKAAEDLATAAYREYERQAAKSPGALLPRSTAEMRRDELWQSFKGGFLATIVTGGLSIPSNTAVNIREANQMKATAKSAPDFETYDKALKNAGNKTYTELDEETRRGVYMAQEDYRQAAAAEEENLRKTRLYSGVDTSTDPVHRDAGGNLYAENIRHTDSGGGTTGVYQGGNPDKAENNFYWKLDYRMEGGREVVEGLRIGEAYEGLKGEILQGFANDTGHEVVWEGETYTSAEGAVKAVHIGFDTRIQKTAENAVEGPSRASGRVLAALTGKEKEFFDKIRAWPGIKSDIEARAGVEALRLNAALNNQTLEEHLASDFEPEMIGAADAALQAAAQEQGGHKKGAVRFDPETGKAMISAFEEADVSTVLHEGAHVLRRKLTGDYLAEAERVFGVKDGVWTEQNEEDFARAYEKYVETGKAPTPKLAELFQKLKEFMGRIYGLVKDEKKNEKKNEKKLSPKQRAFFDRVFRDAQANLEAMEGREAAGVPADAAVNAAPEGGTEEGPLWQPDMSGEDGVIDDPEAGYTEKAGAIVDKAGKVYAAERLLPADRKHGPTAGLISRAMNILDPEARERVIGEIRALRDQYAGTDAEFTAPNGKASLLLESLGEEQGREAWYAVRTASFKEWFGDWEAAARIAEIEGINPVSIKTIENTPEKTDVKTIFKNFGTVKNEHDGRSAIFPSETAGKILKHKGFETGRIVEHFADLFKTSFFAYSEGETYREGHKAHPNIKAYHNYVNKFEYDGKTYYIRFTLHEEAVKQGTGRNNVHSSFISDVELYNDNGETSNQVPVMDRVERSVSPSSDKRLQQFFESVNPSEVSQVRDANGEPKPVFHQTGEVFDIFDTRREGAGTRDQETPYGIFLKDTAGDIGLAGQNQMPLFANIKNPLRVGNRQELAGLLREMPEYADLDRQLRENDRKYQETLDTAEAEENAAYAKWWKENRENPEAPYTGDEKAEEIAGEWREANRGIESRMKELVNQYLKDKGYDGIDLKADEGSFGRRIHTTIALDSTQIKSATGNAGTYGKENPSILFQTIGERGAAALDQAEETTVRLDNLDVARQMETAGKDARAVRLATGWERGADGKWRYETEDIPLDTAGLEQLNENRLNYNFRKKKPQGEYHAPLSEMVTDKELVKTLESAYGKMPHITFSTETRTDGVYTPARNSIDISTWVKGTRIQSVVLHEIQHWIQEKEGFARGGNQAQFTRQNTKQSILDGIDAARQKAFNEIPEGLQEAARKVNRGEDTDGSALALIQADPAAKAAWADYTRALADAAEIAGMADEQFDGLSPAEQYRRLAGEVEARNVQTRMGFTPQQRLETLLAETEDVSREDQIFLTEGAQTGAALADTEDVADDLQAEKPYYKANVQKNVDWLLNAAPVAEIPENAIEMDSLEGKNFVDKIYNLFAKNKTTQVMRGDWKINLSKSGIRSSRIKGMGAVKINVFAALPDIITKGIITDVNRDWKGRGYDSYFINAPLKIGDTEYVVEVIVNRGNDGEGNFYLHEVEKKSKLHDAFTITGMDTSASEGASKLHGVQAGMDTRPPEGASKLNIAHLLGESNTKNENTTILFQDEEDLAAFKRNDPAVVRQAMTFDTPQEFQEYYEALEAYKQPDDLRERAAREAFYATIWEEGQKLKRQEAAQNGTAEAAETGQKTAEDFLDLVNSDEGLMDIVRVSKGLQDSNKDYAAESDADKQRHEAEMRAFNNAFRHQNWENARIQLAQNKPVAPSTARFIRGMVRNNPVPYMQAWAVISGDDSWLPAETRSRLAEGEDFDFETDKSPEELRRIEQAIGHEEIVQKIKDKTLKADDPQLDDYEEELAKRQKADRAKIEKKKEGLSDYAWMIERVELNIEAQERIAAQLAADTTPEGITASRRQQRKVRDAQNQLLKLRKEYASFLESVKLADRANFKEFTTLRRMLARTENALQAAGDLRRIRKNEAKAVLRPPDYTTVHVEQAHWLEWVQSFFDNLPEALPKFIGPKAKNLRELFSDFTTDKNGYREKLKKTLRGRSYSQVEHIIYENTETGKVRDYAKLTTAQRHTLYRLLVENETLFKDLGLDAMEPPRKFSEADSARIRESLAGRIPPDILYKLENLPLDKWQMTDMETLAGIMGDIRREGREHLKAQRDARNKINRDYQGRFAKIVGALLGPKDIERLPGAETDAAEEKREKWRNWAFSQINPRRMFRMFEGGNDGLMYDVVTGGYNRAYDEQTRYEMARREAVQKRLDAAGIKLRELWSNTFTLEDGRNVSLDDMLFYRRAARNDRAYAAVVFGNFAFGSERKAMREANDAGRLDEVLRLEGEVVRRYDAAMKQLDAFLAKPENRKFEAVEEAIGDDYDGHYDRLKEFAARELNLDLGSEAYYIPLGRKSAPAAEQETIAEIFASAGVAHNIEKGFFKNRQDIAPWDQPEVRVGLYKTWNEMITKQEHLMAYAGYLRDMRQIFQDRDSKELMGNIKRKFSTAGTKYIDHFISRIANPQTQRDYTNLNTMTRLMRGHYPAAVLAFRLSSVIKQAVTSPPPFLQFMSLGEYLAAGVECLSEETRNRIRELSPYMASRVIDPANEFIRQMEMETIMGKGGKYEAALAKVEKIGMKPLEWIDSVCVMPGWWGAYKQKLGALERAGGLDAAGMQEAAVRFADQVVQDTQPSARQVDLAPIFWNRENPFMQMFLQFQVPQSVIMQNLFVDAPNNFKQGRIGAALTTVAVYALTAALVGVLDEDDEDEKLNLKRRGIDAFAGFIESIPIYGGYAAYAVEGLLKDGKLRTSQFKPFPVGDEAFKAVNAVTQGQWDRAFIRSLKTFGYYSGLPVGLAGEIEKAVTERNPLALLGWK